MLTKDLREVFANVSDGRYEVTGRDQFGNPVAERCSVSTSGRVKTFALYGIDMDGNNVAETMEVPEDGSMSEPSKTRFQMIFVDPEIEDDDAVTIGVADSLLA